MEKYIENRIAELESVLEEPGSLSEVYRTIALIKSTLEDMKRYTREHPFTDRENEIQYFKVLAPPVYGKFFYYMKVAEIGIEALHLNEERMEALLKLELAKAEQFFIKHGEFCQYYHRNRTFMDDRIFIRDARENEMLDHVEVLMADDFCVGCYWAALLWANGELRGFFNEELRKLKQPRDGTAGAQDLPVMEWTDGVNDLVELIFGLYLKGSFNHGKARLKDIARWMGFHFNIKITNVYGTVKDIARRKKEILKYIDDMRDRSIRRLGDMS